MTISKEPLARLLARLGSDRSRRAYAGDWKRFEAWLHTKQLDVLAVKPRHIEDHLSDLKADGCERTTCGRALSVIRKVYGALVRDEILSVNPAREVDNPKFDSTPRTPYLDAEEARKLLEVPATSWEERRDRLCVRLLLGLGWRRSEVARMCVEDFEEGTVTGIVKGNKRIRVGVPPWLLTDVRDWREFSGIQVGALLPRTLDDLRPVSGDMVYRIVRDVSQKAGVSINPHGLRRTNITLLGERGATLKERQLAVGHSSQSTTEKYDRAREASTNAPGQLLVDIAGGSK